MAVVAETLECCALYLFLAAVQNLWPQKCGRTSSRINIPASRISVSTSTRRVDETSSRLNLPAFRVLISTGADGSDVFARTPSSFLRFGFNRYLTLDRC